MNPEGISHTWDQHFALNSQLHWSFRFTIIRFIFSRKLSQNYSYTPCYVHLNSGMNVL